MAEEQTETHEGYWLDLNVPRRVHRKLAAWGKRLGLTPEGYAKLLIYQGMHGLLAEEQLHEAKQLRAPKQADVPRDTAQSAKSWMTKKPRPGDWEHTPEQKLSFEMWFAALKPYIQCADLLPAPRRVHKGWRLHHADDFQWPEDRRPPLEEMWWDGVRLDCSKEPAEPA